MKVARHRKVTKPLCKVQIQRKLIYDVRSQNIDYSDYRHSSDPDKAQVASGVLVMLYFLIWVLAHKRSL